MNLDEFLRQRSPTWQELDTLLKGQRDALTLAEIEQLGRCYRQAAADLALAQRDFPQQPITTYLNQLVGRAHTAIYRSSPVERWRLGRFVRVDFPRLYRELLPYTMAAFVLFMLGAVTAFFAVWRDPEVIYLLAGQGIRGLVREVEEGKLWTDIAPAARSAASALILTNNIQVTFNAFAGGVTGGLLSAWIMLFNGLNIGGIFGLLQAHGMAAGLADFVVAHGFIELSVIFVAGGCGLAVGDAILRPGLYSRATALRRRAMTTVQVILGCAPLLVIAGIIEGFISPSGLPWWVKLGVGLSTGAALHTYWLLAGRAAPSAASSPPAPSLPASPMPTPSKRPQQA